MTANAIGAQSRTLVYASDQAGHRDESLALTAVSLANTGGGLIYLGIEPDGRVSGLRPDRGDGQRLVRRIAECTHPAIAVRVTPQKLEHTYVFQIEVPRSAGLVATSDGRLYCRRETLRGTFENRPLLPYHFASRLVGSGILDVTAQPVPEAEAADLSDLERARIRQAAARFGGEPDLQTLSNGELDQTLQLTVHYAGRRVPTVTGLLLAGTPEALARHVPANELVIAHPAGKEHDRSPVLMMFERIEQFYQERVSLANIHVGQHLIRVPSLAQECLRESAANAFIHRDYARFGPIQIKWNLNSVSITSPGGFLPGIDPYQLLNAEALTRNPVLATALMRIGLCGRAGRGMDRIYGRLLQYGRPAPSFAQSTPHKVTVELSTVPASLPLLTRITRAKDRLGFALSTRALLLLAQLPPTDSVDTFEAARIAQCDVQQARRLLSMLDYEPPEPRIPADPAPARPRSPGQISQQDAETLLSFARKHGRIRRRDVIDLLGLNGSKATRLLQTLANQGHLQSIGKARSTAYEIIHSSK